jgi:hypothetical protein
MKKDAVSIFVAVLSVLAFFSCSDFTLPKKIKIKATPTVNLPLGNYSKSLTDFFSIEDSLGNVGDGDTGARVLSYEDEDPESQQVQAYLIYYPLFEVPLDFQEYLNRMDQGNSQNLSIEQVFKLPEMPTRLSVPVSIDMKWLFTAIEARFNASLPRADISVNTQEGKAVNFSGFTEGSFREGTLRFTVASGPPLTAVEVDPDHTGVWVQAVRNGQNFEVNLAGRTMTAPFYVRVKSGSTGTVRINASLVTGTAKMRSARGLSLSELGVFRIPIGFTESASLVFSSPGFVHGELDAGSFSIQALPSSFTGFNTSLTARQGIYTYTDEATGQEKKYPGLDFEGFSWDFDKKTAYMNRNPIELGPDIAITVNADGTAGFNGVENDVIKYEITVLLNLEHFEYLRLDAREAGFNEQPAPVIFDPGTMTDWINWVSFKDDGLGLAVKFSEIPIEKTDLKITSGKLRIDDEKQVEKKDVEAGTEYTFTSKSKEPFTREDLAGGLEVTIEAQLPRISVKEFPNLIELENIRSGDDLRLDGNAEIIFNWDRVELKEDPGTGNTANTFPSSGAGIDLSELGDFLKGLEFKKIDGYLYVSGPTAMKPKLTLDALYDNSSQPDSLCKDEKIEVQNVAIELPEPDSGPMKGIDWPPGNLKLDLAGLFNKFPSNLRLRYTIGAAGGAITLTRDDVNETAAFKADLYIVLYLAFDMTNDIELVMDDMFAAGDIFGRTSANDDSMTDILDSLSSLELGIDLENGTGIEAGKFVLTSRPRGGGGGVPPPEYTLLDLSRTGSQKLMLDIDDIKTYPFIPVLKIKFDYNPEGINIARDCNIAINKLGITAGLEYEQDL